MTPIMRLLQNRSAGHRLGVREPIFHAAGTVPGAPISDVEIFAETSRSISRALNSYSLNQK